MSKRQHEERMPLIMACSGIQLFSHYLRYGTIFGGKKLLIIKYLCVLIHSTNLCEKFLAREKFSEILS